MNTRVPAVHDPREEAGTRRGCASHGALRFLYKKTLRRRDIDTDDLPLVRAPKKLPVVLSQEEVVRLIEAALNLRHRTMLMLLYATGLRRAEAVHLKISDIDSAYADPCASGKGLARPRSASHAEAAQGFARVLAVV